MNKWWLELTLVSWFEKCELSASSWRLLERYPVRSQTAFLQKSSEQFAILFQHPRVPMGEWKDISTDSSTRQAKKNEDQDHSKAASSAILQHVPPRSGELESSIRWETLRPWQNPPRMNIETANRPLNYINAYNIYIYIYTYIRIYIYIYIYIWVRVKNRVWIAPRWSVLWIASAYVRCLIRTLS